MNRILGMMEWETRVAECYSMIELTRMASADANAHTKKWIQSEVNRKHGTRAVYSQYMRGFVSGLCRARDNRIMRDLVEYCYRVDGVLYSTHRESTHPTTERFYKGDGKCRLSDAPSGLYWKGTDKPYFLAGETTPFRGCSDGSIAA